MELRELRVRVEWVELASSSSRHTLSCGIKGKFESSIEDLNLKLSELSSSNLDRVRLESEVNSIKQTLH